jgi:hypothetical protein
MKNMYIVKEIQNWKKSFGKNGVDHLSQLPFCYRPRGQQNLEKIKMIMEKPKPYRDSYEQALMIR